MPEQSQQRESVIQHQVNELVRMLEDKGYKGTFLTNGEFADKLKLSLEAFVKTNGHNIHALKQFELFTFSHFKDMESNRVGMHFTTNYTPHKGFEINEIRAIYRDKNDQVLDNKTIRPRSPDLIPTRSEINYLMMSKEQGQEMPLARSIKH